MFCSCEKGCEYCEDGKIYISECPYNYIDDDVTLFNQFYQRYKENVQLYGCFNELPFVLYKYFNILELELSKYKAQTEVEKQKTQDVVGKLMRHKNG